ncbi:MAG: extracellular solute-binding protein [Lachnospiraceae bacterium]|nr:extracellular solute-binding protein [Lachnospiraceae bacterium]
MGKVNFISKSIRKVFIKSAVAVLAFVSAVLCTACGKSNDKTSDKEEKPEYVYEADFKDLGNMKMDSLSRACFNDGKIYMTGADTDYGEDYQINSLKNYLLQCPTGGSKIDRTEISGLKDEEYIHTLFLDDEKNLCIITSVQDYNKEKNQNKQQFYMMKVDESGKASGRIEIKPDKKDKDDFYLSDNIIFSDGRLIAYFGKKVYTFNKDGSSDQTFELDDYIESMFTANGGKPYILLYMEGEGGLCISEFDLKTGKTGEPAGLGNNTIHNINRVKEAANGNVYLSNNECLYEFDFKKNKAEPVFNWINVDIDGYSISDFIQIEDGSFFVLNTIFDYSSISSDDVSSDIEIATITKKKYSDTRQKEKLTLASVYLGMDIKREILKFNKMDDNYRIEVADYSSYEDPGKQMNLDIAAGQVPDIIDVAYMPKELYIKKGFLADLYPLMEKDGEIKKEDFIDTVRTTIEHDGKLYYLPVFFRMHAFAGSKKLFGNMEGWSYEDMEKMYNDMPEGSSFMYNMTSEWFIENMLSAQMENFINYNTKEVNLNSEEFINMIEFSKNFKDNELDTSSDDSSYVMSEAGGGSITVSSNDASYELIRKGKVLLKSMELYDFSDIQINEKLYKDQGGYNIISYPSSDKNNKIAISSSGNSFAISEKCGNKEGAWKFLQRLYTYEFQKSGIDLTGFPIRQDAIDKKMEYAMAAKPYTDDDGTKVVPVTNYSYKYGDFKITLKPYTKEHMDIFNSLIGRIGTEIDFGADYNEIPEIIKEEIKAVYSGDKTAKEAADIIQSRVSIYVNENA